MNIDAIWKEYGAYLRRFLSSKVSNDADVEDLLQTILIKTHQNLHTLSSVESIKPWLYQIASHSIIDFYRGKNKGHELRAEDLWYEESTEDIEYELADCIQPFINALPPKYSDLLTAIDLHGESQKRYAEKHKISYSTLKSRVKKSRQELRNLFDNCCNLSLDARGNVIDCNNKSKECRGC